MSTAIILAGGKGTRFANDCPKQFVCLGGSTPVIIFTLRVFEQHPQVERIIVVCAPEWMDYVKEQCNTNNISKVVSIVPNGDTSHDSLRNGIREAHTLCTPDDIIIVHESVRPLVTAEMITNGILICSQKGNAVTAVTGNEALLFSPDGQQGSEMHARETMYQVQMPQFFPLRCLDEAFTLADRMGIKAQSLNVLMERLGFLPLYINRGSLRNMKLTSSEDIPLFEYLLSQR